MANFNQQDFNQFAVEHVVGFFPEQRTLASGRKSHWYANWRNVMNDVYLANQLSDFLVLFCQDQSLEPDCFFGVPEGATKLAFLTQNKLAWLSSNYGPGSHCLPMGRAQPKNHGDPKDRYFVGEPRGNIIVVEDVTTTGSSLITKGIRPIFELISNTQNPPRIIRAIGLTDRLETTQAGENICVGGISVRKALDMLDVEYNSLSNAEDLLPLAVKRYNPSKEIRQAIEQEYQDHGVVQINLA